MIEAPARPVMPEAPPRAIPPRRSPSRHRRLFLVDAALFVTFVAVMDVPLTGLAVHEWLGILVGVATVVHLVQHGSWILTTGSRFVSSTSFMNRLNYVMMGLLFGAFATIIVSGLVISEVALPLVGVVPTGGDFWIWLHLSSVMATVWVTALHVAFNWRWTVCALDRYLAAPAMRMVRRWV
jgi:hypothetical protein